MKLCQKVCIYVWRNCNGFILNQRGNCIVRRNWNGNKINISTASDCTIVRWRDQIPFLYSRCEWIIDSLSFYKSSLCVISLINIYLTSHFTRYYPSCMEILTFVFYRGNWAASYHYEDMPIQIYWKFYHQKWIFQIKDSDFVFHISAQNIDCGYSLEPPQRGGSNVYPQSMFLSRNKKNNVYTCKPQFYCIKVGFKGVKII